MNPSHSRRPRPAFLGLAGMLVLLASFARAHAASPVDSLDIVASVQDRAVLDANGDGKGDASGSVQAVEGRVGEHQIDRDRSRYCVLFELTETEAERIADRSGAKVTFNIFFVGKLNARGLAAKLVAIPLRDTNGPTFNAEDFHSEGSTVLEEAVTDFTRGAEFVSLDITRHVRTAVKDGARRLAFRFELAAYPEEVMGDGVVNRFIFASADSPTPPFLRVGR